MTWLIANWIGIAIGLFIGWQIPMPVWATKLWDSIRGTITTVVKKNAATAAASVVTHLTDDVTNHSSSTGTAPVKSARPYWADDNK